MNVDRNDIDDELIARSLTGEASAEDEKQLSDWIGQSQANRDHYLSLKKTFDLTKTGYKNSAPVMELDVDREWQHFIDRIDKKKTRTLVQDRRTSTPWLRIAAAIILLAGMGAVINYFISGSTTRFSTTDQTLAISLSDGSRILLNRNSEFSYNSDFGSATRSVKLKGEAFFEVARDPRKPFIIQVNDARVEVLGTSFDVQGYDDHPEIEVTVETGIVKLSTLDLKKEVKLHAGEKGIYSRSSRQVSSLRNDNVNFLAWNTRKLVFVESDLRKVIQTINDVYGAHITITSEIPASCVVTVTFDRQSLESVLHVLKTTLNLTYRSAGDQIEVTHACLP